MTGGTDFATVAQLGNYVTLNTNQTISATKVFTALPESGVVPTTGNQLTNKTYVDGLGSVYVTLSTAQTISGLKTFSGNVRINNTRGLILGTTYPTAGGFINYTTPNVYYDVTGGSHLFFVGGTPTVDLDTTGLVIRGSKKLSFYNGGSWIYEDSAASHLDYNVPTGYYHSLRFNNVEKLKFSSDTNGASITFPTSGIVMREYTGFGWLLYDLPASTVIKYRVAGNDIMEVASGGTTLYESLSLRNGKRVVWDEGFTNVAHIRKDTVNNILEYEVASGYSHRFNVNGVQQLLLNTSGAVITGDLKLKYPSSFYPDDATGGRIVGSGAGGFRFDADISADYKFYGDSTLLLTVAADGVILNSTAVGAAPMPNNRLFLSANKANYIGSTTTDMRYNCSSGGSHNFYQNGTTYLGFWNSLGMTLSPNNASFQMGTTSPIQIKHDTATTELQYRTLGGYEHMFYIDGSLYYEMRTDTFRMLRGWQCKQGATGAYVSNNLNTSWNVPVAGLSCWIDTTRLGTFTISDYRVKECIVPARPVLERLCKVKMIEYEHKDISIFKKSGRHHGFIAHEVAELFPELDNIVAGEKDALTDDGLIQPQSIQPEWTNLYLSAIQELNAKIEAQQKQIDGLVLALSKIVSA